MKHAKKILSVMVAAAVVLAAAPSTLWAESAVTDPGAFGILVDPNASGTKVSSFVTLSYDYETDTERANACDSLRYVRNLYLVATTQKGNDIRPFSSNYAFAGLNNLPDCWDNQANQLFFFKYFLEQVVIAGLFNCTSGACPAYAVKSIKNFLTTGVGGASMEVELSVK